MTTNEKKFLNTIKNGSDNLIELLNIIRNSDNPEKAVIIASKIINHYLEHPEISDLPEAEQRQILQNIA